MHRGIERIIVVEPNEGILEAARRWFPSLASAFGDSRVKIVDNDASDFVRDTKERFDVVIVDDPAGCNGDGPQAQAFYCDCFRILSGDGVLVSRTGSASTPQKRRELVARAGKVKRLFPIYRLYRSIPPAGEPGETLLGFASKRYDPIKDFDDSGWNVTGIDTRYYTPDIHRGAFALPRYLEELVSGI